MIADALTSSLSQGSLDNIVTRQPRAPAFSTDGLVDYIVELVVCEDKVRIRANVHDSEVILIFIKAFQLVDKDPFRRLLMFLRPSLSDKDIPHRQTLRKVIINKASVSEARVKQVLKVSTHYF
jgi:hypothetical protein